MKNYTPSPWKTEVIDTINGEPGYWHIVQQSTKGVIGDVQSVNSSDAQLIAAAPDLLEACIEALSLFDNYPQCYEAIGTYQVLNNAIKKATQ